MMNSVMRRAADVSYRLGIGPRPSDVPDHRLVELVEGPERLPPGRALDLGCGTGRNAIYVAGRGWDSVGVEMSGYAIEVAKGKAATQGVPARFVQGDVTRLPELDIGVFNLFMDGGCYHTIPPSRRNAYAESVTAVAALGARLILVGFQGSPRSWRRRREAARAVDRLATSTGRSDTGRADGAVCFGSGASARRLEAGSFPPVEVRARIHRGVTRYLRRNRQVSGLLVANVGLGAGTGQVQVTFVTPTTQVTARLRAVGRLNA